MSTERHGSVEARSTGATQELASFVSALQFDDLPRDVVGRAGELFADWAASATAGCEAKPVQALDGFAQRMGPGGGPCETLATRRRTSPLFAALVNAASSHVVEQDDVHNGSVFHPGAVVFPAVLAAAQETGASGRETLTAAVAGYETGIRVGEYLGKSHYRIFHTTGTAGIPRARLAYHGHGWHARRRSRGEPSAGVRRHDHTARAGQRGDAGGRAMGVPGGCGGL